MNTTCSECNLPMRLTKQQALELDCSGIHFLEEDGESVPIRKKGLRVGSNTVMKGVDHDTDVYIGTHCDIYFCKIGAHTKIKSFVEIQGGVEIGKFCKVESFVFIPSGVRIGNYCFIGPGTVFTNDRYPSSVGEWQLLRTTVEDNVSIGAHCTILPGLKIGRGSLIGASSVVTKDIKPDSIYFGNPARFVRPI